MQDIDMFTGKTTNRTSAIILPVTSTTPEAVNRGVSESEFCDLGSRMAQELQEFVDDAEAAGDDVNPLVSVQALIDEWEALFRRTSMSWQNSVSSENTNTHLIASL